MRYPYVLILLHVQILKSMVMCLDVAKVKTTQGWLQGEVLQTVTGDFKYFSFKGIPYARPPLGLLRFKDPRSPLRWNGVRQAISHGSVCPQVDVFTKEVISGSEDCLFLNVYSPQLKPEILLPVMFFIHGGAFKSGSGNVDHYGPDFLIQYGVVLVTINYRLDALGLLCLDTEEVPGNAAFKDQVAALKWVSKNIANFGGDPNKVTIFGESAGGASVTLHMSSPMSKGLFIRAIPMSGVSSCDWSVSFEPRRRAFQLGKILGFETNDTNKLLEYLQSVPVSQLVNTHPYITSSEERSVNIIKMYHFVPVAEKNFGGQHFLNEDPTVVHKSGYMNEVDILLGHTNNEALLMIPTYEDYLLEDYNNYPELLIPIKMMMKIKPNVIFILADIIKKYYFGSKPINTHAMREFITYANEITFFYEINKFIRQVPNLSKRNKYFYTFSGVSSRNIYGGFKNKYNIRGATHLEDLMYLFDAKKYNLTVVKNSKEYHLINNLCSAFTNFAKYGTPTPDLSLGVIWPLYDILSRSYVDIGDQLTVKHGSGDAVCGFWDNLYRYAGVEN